MFSQERLPTWIGSGSPASIERAALVGGDAPGLAETVCALRLAFVTLEQSACLFVACRQWTNLCRR